MSKRIHRPSGTRPTLEDVAREAGVSTATVSRTLSSPQKVRIEVRERVMSVIHELGYTPHGAARALASRRTNTIGALVPTLDNAIFATVIQTLQEEVSAKERTLLVGSTEYSLQNELNQVEKLVVRGVDGVMLTGEERAPQVYDLLDRHRVRYVCTYFYEPSTPHPNIGFRNIDSMIKVVSYLHDLGHRRFAMISGVKKENDRAEARAFGVNAALAERGLHIDAAHFVEAHYTIHDGRKAFREIFAENTNRPTAVICGNDILAFGALFEANTMGLRVPEDVSITGFDDLDLAKELSPGLTTIHAPLVRMGSAAARYLLADEGDDIADKIEFTTELVVRGSTGPAPG